MAEVILDSLWIVYTVFITAIISRVGCKSLLQKCEEQQAQLQKGVQISPECSSWSFACEISEWFISLQSSLSPHGTRTNAIK